MPEENNPAHDEDVNAPTVPPISDKRTPLPILQMSILFLIQFSEPVAGLVIYPFINQFVRETGVTQGDERKTGYYAGIIVRCSYFFSSHHNHIHLSL